MTTLQEILDRMPEEERRRVDELAKALEAEMAFWDSLPEAERNKRLEKPKVRYDAASDTLWLHNGRPTPRQCEIVKGRVIAFFEAEIWYPSAVKVSGASELLLPFFDPANAPVSPSPVVRRGDDGIAEQCLNLAGVEVRYENLSDYLWIGNGGRPWEGAEIAEDLIVSYAEDSNIPVGAALFKAAELLTPVLAAAHAKAPPRLV